VLQFYPIDEAQIGLMAAELKVSRESAG
jgi:hypothetical protein